MPGGGGQFLDDVPVQLPGVGRCVGDIHDTCLPASHPLPFRYQNGGDYDERLVLRPGLATGRDGLDVHYLAG
ncbi:hypothetical protein GCM10027521_51860 [Amycolatopsis cihanbeyliensis]